MRRFVGTLALLPLLALACTSGDDGAQPPTPPVGSARPSTPGTTRTPSPTASPRPGPPKLVPVGTFDQPLYVTAPPGDDRLFVVEKTGRVRIVRAGRTLPEPFLDLRGEVSTNSERGLLSIAFAPDYATSGHVYADYTDRAGDTRVVEYTVRANDPDRLDPGSRRELLKIDQPYPNHNGGLLIFDPTGMLLVGLGDGGSGGDPGNRAQRLGVLLGKILRIDPRPSGRAPYSVPADNPFVGRPGVRPEIWAYGLRNPWRFSFDPETGDFYLGDVGQNRLEELDVVAPADQAGANYGWRVFEGDRRHTEERIADESRLVRPVLVYGHDESRCSITGGVVYRGPVTRLSGRYLYGDYCTGEIWSIPAGRAASPRPRLEPIEAESLASFGYDGRGELYVVSLGGGVWRVTA